jgi:hypothetical protein
MFAGRSPNANMTGVPFAIELTAPHGEEYAVIISINGRCVLAQFDWQSPGKPVDAVSFLNPSHHFTNGGEIYYTRNWIHIGAGAKNCHSSRSGVSHTIVGWPHDVRQMYDSDKGLAHQFVFLDEQFGIGTAQQTVTEAKQTPEIRILVFKLKDEFCTNSYQDMRRVYGYRSRSGVFEKGGIREPTLGGDDRESEQQFVVAGGALVKSAWPKCPYGPEAYGPPSQIVRFYPMEEDYYKQNYNTNTIPGSSNMSSF